MEPTRYRYTWFPACSIPVHGQTERTLLSHLSSALHLPLRHWNMTSPLHYFYTPPDVKVKLHSCSSVSKVCSKARKGRERKRGRTNGVGGRMGRGCETGLVKVLIFYRVKSSL